MSLTAKVKCNATQHNRIRDGGGGGVNPVFPLANHHLVIVSIYVEKCSSRCCLSSSGADFSFCHNFTAASNNEKQKPSLRPSVRVPCSSAPPPPPLHRRFLPSPLPFMSFCCPNCFRCFLLCRRRRRRPHSIESKLQSFHLGLQFSPGGGGHPYPPPGRGRPLDDPPSRCHHSTGACGSRPP